MKHPAPYSKQLYPYLIDAIKGFGLVLDPFAGIGRIHEIGDLAGVQTVGVELEPEWASQSPRTVVGDALSLPFADRTFDAACFSPTYGNRLADRHNAKDDSYRRSYKHDLGRDLNPRNSGTLQWGLKYQEFTTFSYLEISRVVKEHIVLNISDHVRKKKVVPVTDFHVDALTKLGWRVVDKIPVTTPRLRVGANSDARVECEWVICFHRSLE